VANQIAAGEVVERPASVLKELLENSLDAGATDIEVSVEAGGMRAIRVRDNGHGIHKDDLQLALTRHATSKVHTPSDLACIGSLGFRGEALASIASVARVSLTSRWHGAAQAWKVIARSDSGLPEIEPASLPRGTEVEVRELFYNTPARRRFLKSERTEFQHIQESMTRLALSHAHVAMHLKHNGRTVFRLPAACAPEDELARVGRLLGRAFVQRAVPLSFSRDAWMLSGWLAMPDFHRSQTDMQHFFVNGRPVRDKLVMHAVREAYQGLLPAGRSPAYILYLVLPGAEVDVNVHPTKHEVRFHQSRSVHDFIVHAIRQVVDDMATTPRHASSSLAASSSRATSPHGSYSRSGMPMPSAVAETSAVPWLAEQSAATGWLRQGHFWLGEYEAQLWLVDAAKLWSASEHLEGEGCPAQPLLCPWRWDLTPEQAERLRRAGWLLEASDQPGQWVILSLPSLFAGVDETLLYQRARGCHVWPKHPPEAWLQAGRRLVQDWLPALPGTVRVACSRLLTAERLHRLFAEMDDHGA
jgi:DNA mismatch repair protein MutL